MASPTTHHGINPHQLELNLRPPHSQGSALTPLLPTKCQATNPLSPHAYESFLNHLELGRQWKVIVFHIYFVNRRVRILKTKNLYGNNT
jgi:hypothetical protein